jgi:hypothetical protein
MNALFTIIGCINFSTISPIVVSCTTVNMTASSCRKVFKMHFPFLILNFFLAYVAASEVTIDDQKEAKIRSIANEMMRVIENEIKNQTIEQGSLSKRNYDFYPYIFKQFYPKVYGIVKSGCDENNPYLYRPAPGGGFYPPLVSAVYKREEAVDHEVDGITENAKILQKQLLAEWGKIPSGDNSLTRRGRFITSGFNEAIQSIVPSSGGRQIVQGATRQPNYAPYNAAAAHNMRNYQSQAANTGQNIQYITGGQNMQAITGGQNMQAITGGQNMQAITGGQNIQYITGGQNIPNIIDYHAYAAAASQNMPITDYRAYAASQNIPIIDYRRYAASQNIPNTDPYTGGTVQYIRTSDNQADAIEQVSRQEVDAPIEVDAPTEVEAPSVVEVTRRPAKRLGVPKKEGAVAVANTDWNLITGIVAATVGSIAFLILFIRLLTI